jgi:molecular chaperone HtpG
MEKVLKKMPGSEGNVPKAALVLEINMDHPVAAALKKAYAENHDEAARCAKILYAQARLISGLGVADPTEFSRLVCEMMAEKIG